MLFGTVFLPERIYPSITRSFTSSHLTEAGHTFYVLSRNALCMYNRYPHTNNNFMKFCVDKDEDEWLNESNCEMIKKFPTVDGSSDPGLSEFKKQFRKSGMIAEPNYCIDERGKLIHITQVQGTEQRREVVVREREQRKLLKLYISREVKEFVSLEGLIHLCDRSQLLTSIRVFVR